MNPKMPSIHDLNIIQQNAYQEELKKARIKVMKALEKAARKGKTRISLGKVTKCGLFINREIQQELVKEGYMLQHGNMSDCIVSWKYSDKPK